MLIRLRFYLPHLAIILSSLLLVNCGIFNKNKTDKAEAGSERALYESAQKFLEAKQFDLAIESLRQIELQYPFGRYAEQAQLESIFAYYKNYEPAAASASAERFIRQYPDHPDLDYAYYMKGLASYTLDQGFLDRLVKDSTFKRDLTAAKHSYFDFRSLIERFPNSDYAADARKRMIYLRDILARHEIGIASYYMQRAAYLAAVNRCKYVIEKYPTTSAIPDALAIMTQAYQEMGMNDLAQDSLSVLKHNYPNYSKLNEDGSLDDYDKLYQDDTHWLSFLSFGLIKTNSKNEKQSKSESSNSLDAMEPPEYGEQSSGDSI